MAFDPVNDADIEAGKPTKQEIFKKTKDNQGDHESRISDIESTISVQTLTGEVKPYSGGVAPSGWLLCDGSAVSRTTYADLFAVTGTAFGIGDGSTTFNIPDGRGRMFLGVNNGGLPNGATGSFATRNRGDAGGAEVETLTEGMLPPHTHSVDITTYPTSGSVANNNKIRGEGFDSSVGTQSETSGSVGSGDDVGLMNPFLVMNYLIKT